MVRCARFEKLTTTRLSPALDIQLFPLTGTPVEVTKEGPVFPIRQMTAIFQAGAGNYKGKVAYHYANAAVWPQIVRSKELWLTDYNSLLDPSEGLYGLSVVYKRVLFDKGFPDVIKNDKICEIFKYWLVAALKSSQFYVCSLCLAPDDIGLWRSYSGEGGASLGIAIDHVINYSNTRNGLRVEPVEYNPYQQWINVKGLVSELVELITSRGEEAFTDPMPSATATRLAYAAMLMKNPCYAQEREIRIISDREIIGRHYRNLRKSKRVRYTKISLEECMDVEGQDHPVFPTIFSSPGMEPNEIIEIVKNIQKDEGQDRHLCLMAQGSTVPYVWG